MKKILIVLIITICLLIISGCLKKDKQITYEDSFIKEVSKLKYYNKKYNKRYISYYHSHTDYSYEDIVIQVNIGLDKPFYTNTTVSKFLNKNYILVNKYTYLPSNYVPNDLILLDRSYSRDNMYLVKEAAISFKKMYTAAIKDGYKIRIMSSYRSYEYQRDLYDKYVKIDGKKEADAYSARPGFSEHQTGLCVDIDDGVINYQLFEKSRSYLWMKKNSYKYGFIERYPKNKENITGYSYESWHYRYVGKEIAKYIHQNNITLDEYVAMFLQK